MVHTWNTTEVNWISSVGVSDTFNSEARLRVDTVHFERHNVLGLQRCN